MTLKQKFSIATGIISAIVAFIAGVGQVYGQPWAADVLQIGGLFAIFANAIFAALTGKALNTNADSTEEVK